MTTNIEERELDVTSNGHKVPTALWIPTHVDYPVSVVLLGHGGGGHKRAPTIVKMAAGLAQERGLASLAIDGPVNGDREANDDAANQLRREDRSAYRRKYYMEKYDEMVADWRAALDAAQALPEIDDGPVGYWGLSMGTRFGAPLIAAEPRIKAAVIGLFGYGAGNEVNQPVYDAVVRIDIPILFVQQRHDDEVSQRAYYDLFERIGTEDKRLHVNPGKHAQVPQSELEATRLFLARKLRSIRV
jgi:dienelactone hydrolase